MGACFLSLVFFSLAALRGCYAQDIDGLQANFLKLKAIEDAKVDYASVALEMEAALADMEDLWGESFQQLLEEDPSGFMGFSEKCVESAMKVYAAGGTEIPPGNITLPGPEVFRMLDATGKQGAGLLKGNVIAYGAYDQCYSIEDAAYCLAKQITPTFTISTALPITWTVGFCVPKHCTAQDLTLLINYTRLFQVVESTVYCSDTVEPSYSAGAIVMLVVCAVFVMLILQGTLVDVFLNYMPQILETDVQEIDENPSINSEGEAEGSPLLINNRSVVKRSQFQTDKKKASPIEFITAFSLLKTVPTLLATKQAPGVITNLNGLRVISMFWVILGHTFFWIFSSNTVRIDNLPAMLGIARRFSFQAVGSAFFAVDSFFFLSGVLVAYLTLRQMKRAKGKFPVLKYYIHRILRLTPTYAFVLFFAWFLTNHLAYGPELNGEPFGPTCEKYWWTNLLYINNLYPWGLGDECIGWTWYLSNDMQFYVIAPLILIPAYFMFPVALVVAGVFILGGGIITGALTIAYDFQANSFSALAYGYTGKGTSTMSYTNAIYIKPWDRIAPYMVGLILGCILYKGINLKKLNKYLRLLLYVAMWCVSGFVMFWLTYGLYFTWNGHTPHRFENFLYIVSSRFLWAASLALIVFACHNGYGWVVNSFLSMPVWTPLSRMTFNAYLVHPIMMTVVYGQLQTTLHYTDITIAGLAIMFVVLSYGAAAVVCVAVEFPLSTIEMKLFNLAGAIRCKGKNQSYVNIPNNSRHTPNVDMKA